MNDRATIIDGSPKTGRLADVMPSEGVPNIEGNYVPSVLAGSSDIKLVNGYSSGHEWDILAVDRSTEKFEMYRDTMNATPGSCRLCVLVSICHSLYHILNHCRPIVFNRHNCFTVSWHVVYSDWSSDLYGQ